MKKIVMVIAAFFVLCGCSNTQQSSSDASSGYGYETQTVSPIENVSITIPASYNVYQNEYGNTFYRDDNAVLTVTTEICPDYIDNVYNYGFHALEEYSNTFDEINNQTEIAFEVDGLKCRVMEFEYVIYDEPDNVKKQCYIGYIMKDRTIYIVTCVSDPLEYVTEREYFENAVKSVDITDKEETK